MSALHTAISHFYHDSYFRRFRSVYKLRLLLLTFDLWFVTSKLQWLQHAFLPIDEGEISLPAEVNEISIKTSFGRLLRFWLGDSTMASVA